MVTVRFGRASNSATRVVTQEQHAFRLLGLLTFESFPDWVLAVLLDDPELDAEGLAENLWRRNSSNSTVTTRPESRGFACMTCSGCSPESAFMRRRAKKPGRPPSPAWWTATSPWRGWPKAGWAVFSCQPVQPLRSAYQSRWVGRTPTPCGTDHRLLRVEKANLVATAALARELARAPGMSLSRSLNTFFIWHAHWDDSLRTKENALDAARGRGPHAKPWCCSTWRRVPGAQQLAGIDQPSRTQPGALP